MGTTSADFTPPSSSPVPSFTMLITPEDTRRFLEASKAVQESLDEKTTQPLHQACYQAAQLCKNPLVASYLDRVGATKMTPLEAQLGTLLFEGSNKTSKLGHWFGALGDSNTLGAEGLQSLFKSILFALSCCVKTPEHTNTIVVEGKPAAPSPDRPTKKVKREEDDTETTKPLSDVSVMASQSFDSSLATMRSEDGELGSLLSLKKEIEQVAEYASDEIIKYAAKDDNKEVDLELFEKWYEEKGKSVVPWLELLEVSSWKNQESAPVKKIQADESMESPASLLTECSDSKTILSFDFSDPNSTNPIVVHITEDNILALNHLVSRTGLSRRHPEEVCRMLLKLSPQRKTLSLSQFKRDHLSIIPKSAFEALSETEKNAFQEDFVEYFTAFEGLNDHSSDVDLRELSLGFCLFCAENKSTKLALGFDLLDVGRTGFLSEQQLLRYLKSYLSMLVATSFLTPIAKRKTRPRITDERRSLMHAAVHRGAQWTVGHFVKANPQLEGKYTFDSFAEWYSVSGYNVAPWLELLDLHKILALVSDPASPLRLPPLNDAPQPSSYNYSGRRDRVSSLRRHHSARRRKAVSESLFTFPLANRRSLVVLKEDATYVREVVETLQLLTVKPEQLWEAMSTAVRKRSPPRPRHINHEPDYVDMKTFVQCIQEICPRLSRKRSHPGESIPTLATSTGEVLANFFQCFDLNQLDRVAIDELMGGLSLLCGGKKSTKLAFAFGIFDTRPIQSKKRTTSSLSGEDLFLFLRSILIVTFSCCRQSLDMSDEVVGRCIADTANMICNEVMRYQWETKHTDRLDFDEFGQWYNDGGYERAPWLELLDLKKWVMVDDFNTLEKKVATSSSFSRSGEDVPPPPPEDALDHNFFDENAIMPMDSLDEMDMILMQPSMDKGDIQSPRIGRSFSYSSSSPPDSNRPHPLRFHLVTHEQHGGYILSVSSIRIGDLRRVLEKSGLHMLQPETVCNEILQKSSRTKISKQSYTLAMQNLIPMMKKKGPDQKLLSDVLLIIFDSFDPEMTGRATATEVACGLTVLCRGKKSDKLEFAFEILDSNKRGRLQRAEMNKCFQCFLSILLSIALTTALDHDELEDTLTTIKGSKIDRNVESVYKVARNGAHWAGGIAFQNFRKGITFDDFATWYTQSGYGSIPWLELLDLHKWVLAK